MDTDENIMAFARTEADVRQENDSVFVADVVPVSLNPVSGEYNRIVLPTPG